MERRNESVARDHLDEMVAMRRDGAALSEIAERFGLSRQRVDQLVTTLVPVSEARAGRGRRAAERLGRLRDEVLAAIRDGDSPAEIRKRFRITGREYLAISRSDPLAYRHGQSARNVGTGRDPTGDIRAAADVLGRVPGQTVYDRLRKEGKLPAGALTSRGVVHRYGSWSEAVRDAGLTPNSRPRNERVGVRLYSDEDYLNMLRDWHDRHEKWPSVDEWEASGPVSSTAIRLRFGNWMTAIEEAARRKTRDLLY